eukprot:scaffold237043_cov21-Tisochrysis_lutea.AAC.2
MDCVGIASSGEKWDPAYRCSSSWQLLVKGAAHAIQKCRISIPQEKPPGNAAYCSASGPTPPRHMLLHGPPSQSP